MSVHISDIHPYQVSVIIREAASAAGSIGDRVVHGDDLKVHQCLYIIQYMYVPISSMRILTQCVSIPPTVYPMYLDIREAASTAESEGDRVVHGDD